jgi:hypothetical protein
VVRFIESFPDPNERDQLGQMRRNLDPVDYERNLASVFQAWASNWDLFKRTLRQTGLLSPED